MPPPLIRALGVSVTPEDLHGPVNGLDSGLTPPCHVAQDNGATSRVG